jgi:hypothetical protein
MVAAFALAPAMGLRAQPGSRDAAVPFKVGERLTYDVTWSTFLVAGTAYATVAARVDAPGSPAYHIVADGRPIPLLQRLYNVYYKMESMLDTVTLLPQRMSLYSEERAANGSPTRDSIDRTGRRSSSSTTPGRRSRARSTCRRRCRTACRRCMCSAR